MKPSLRVLFLCGLAACAAMARNNAEWFMPFGLVWFGLVVDALWSDDT